MRYFEGDVSQQAEYFSCCWSVWKVILTVIRCSFSIWLLLWVERHSHWVGFLSVPCTRFGYASMELWWLAVVKFFSELDTSLGNQVWRQIFDADTVPSLSTNISRVRHVSMEDDYSTGVSSDVENSAIITGGHGRGGGCGIIVIAIQGEDVDTEIRVHVIVLTVVETIIHLINDNTSLVNPSELRLLTLHIHLLQLLPPPLVLPLCRLSSQIMNIPSATDCSCIPVS